jgi:Protein of unknown function (DUF4236)
MGWRFRRSLKLGPLKLNFSKSGVGYSIGGRGFRVGKDVRGRSYSSASIPGTGLYNRTYSSQAHPQAAIPTSGAVQRPETDARPRRGLALFLLFAAGILVGMLLMAVFSSKPAPTPVAPPVQTIANPAPPAPQHPAKRRSHRARAGDSGPASAPVLPNHAPSQPQPQLTP